MGTVHRTTYSNLLTYYAIFYLKRMDLEILPLEIRVHIWSFLDSKTLQNICIFVCKAWLKEIRACLSEKMKLNNQDLSNEEINSILSGWTDLQVLQFTNGINGICSGFHLDKLSSSLNSYIDDDDIIKLDYSSCLRKGTIHLKRRQILRIFFTPNPLPSAVFYYYLSANLANF